MIAFISVAIRVFLGVQFGLLARSLWNRGGHFRLAALFPAGITGVALLSVLFAAGEALGFSESLPFLVDMAYWFGIELPMNRWATELAKILGLA